MPNAQDGNRPGGVIYEATCGCSFAHNYPLAFGPRPGFAYQITPKTVIRGGAGIIYNGTANDNVLTRQVTSKNMVSSTAFGQPAMTLATGVPLTLAQIAYPNFSASDFPITAVPGTPGPPTTYYVDPNAGRPSRSYQWSIGVQREVMRDLVVDVSYVGNRGIWWPTSTPVNYNALTPQGLLADGIDITTAAGRAILNAPHRQCGCRPVPGQTAVLGFPAYCDGSAIAAAVPAVHHGAERVVGAAGKYLVQPLQLKVTEAFFRTVWISLITLPGRRSWTTASNPTASVRSERPRRSTMFSIGLRTNTLSIYSRPLVSNINFSYTVPKFGQQQNPEERSGRLASGSPSHVRQRDAHIGDPDVAEPVNQSTVPLDVHESGTGRAALHGGHQLPLLRSDQDCGAQSSSLE